MSSPASDSISSADWQQRLDDIMEMMRETSRHTDPQSMVAAYARRISRMYPSNGFVAVSRRDISAPKYRVTRFSGWQETVNPWKQRDKLPVLEGGLLGELLYSGEPRIIDELTVPDDDPSAEYLAGQRSLMAVPHLENGESLNMIFTLRAEPYAFARNDFPEIVWTSILFGRSTHNLVLAEQLRAAYNVVDRELQIVGDIQRSLLPAELPDIPTLKLAAHYQTSQRAGGDYYDFFPLHDGRYGILIADVSGHGTPAAVMMAVTHSIAHMYPASPGPPSDMLNFVSRHLTQGYSNNVGAFVTAFYCIYDPRTRELMYSSAGHNPPRLKSCRGGGITALDGAQKFPLGITSDVVYENASVRLQPGDQIVFYTDGITEANDPAGNLFGIQRLDAVLSQCCGQARDIIDAILASVAEFAAGEAATDDRTVVVAKVE
ncbi:MAG: PP2C family protein-serine/threonine phosphatase [Pirellulales bacterium]